MKKLLSSLLLALTVIVAAAPAHADDACKNLASGFVRGTLSVGGEIAASDTRATSQFIPVSPGETYTVSVNGDNFVVFEWVKYRQDKSFIGYGPTINAVVKTLTIPDGVYFIRYSIRKTDNATFGLNDFTSQFEKGSTATSYVPYNPLCATCQGIVKTYESATGTVVQNGTPTPTNPIEPVFYTQGDMVLRKVGDYADSYDATTGKITRRVGVKVLDGTENWWTPAAGNYWVLKLGQPAPSMARNVPQIVCSHLKAIGWTTTDSAPAIGLSGNATGDIGVNAGALSAVGATDITSWKAYLTSQYSAGTPVVVYYPLATETTENWNETTYCAPNIKIATTAYNAARFNPVKTDLNNAVATIREIVTKTINQTAAIASLQADKQTRPEEQCPAGKKCLLVETEENGVVVPHWFPIIEAPEDN